MRLPRSNSTSTERLSPTARAFEISTRVEEVENARELVKNGVIHGVLSSDTFQGRINSRLIHLPTWNPYSDLGLIVYKATFPIFPEPEIYYPAGTDIRLKTKAPVSSLPHRVKNGAGSWTRPIQRNWMPGSSKFHIARLPRSRWMLTCLTWCFWDRGSKCRRRFKRLDGTTAIRCRGTRLRTISMHC